MASICAVSACVSASACKEPEAPFVLPEGVYEKYDDPNIVAREACLPQVRPVFSIPSTGRGNQATALMASVPEVTDEKPWEHRKKYKHDDHKGDEKDDEEDDGAASNDYGNDEAKPDEHYEVGDNDPGDLEDSEETL